MQPLAIQALPEAAIKEKNGYLSETIATIRDRIGLENLPSKTDFERPNNLWFDRIGNEYTRGIHGIAHLTRVAVWSQVLGRLAQKDGQTIDLEVLRWVSAVHDVKRQDDNVDQSHGSRVAKWFLEVADQIGAQSLTSQQKQFIANICQFDEKSNFGEESTPSEIACFKDADILERVRIADLNPKFLNFDISSKLIPAAVALFDLSERYFAEGVDAFDAVIKAAEKLGLLKDSKFYLSDEESKCYDSVDIITY